MPAMANRKNPETKLIPPREVRVLLASPHTRDGDLSERTSHEVMLLEDGRALVLRRDGKGILWPSRDALDEMNREIEEEMRRGPVDLMKTLLPPASEFITHASAHATSLATKLRVSADALDT